MIFRKSGRVRAVSFEELVNETALRVVLSEDAYRIQIKEALKIGVDGFLLDNMSPAIVAKAVKMIRNYNGGKNIFIEASGGITIKNLSSYLDSGVNAISIGAITHSVISKDIRLEFSYK